MGYDEEMANVNASLIETKQLSNQYNNDGNNYSFGGDVGLVINSKSTGISSDVRKNDSLIDSYKQMVKEGSISTSNRGNVGILENRNLITAAKVEVIKAQQNFDPHQKKQRDDDEFYMNSSNSGNSLVNSYKNLVTERGTSVGGISSAGGSINSSSVKYQINECHRRDIKSTSTSTSNGNNNSRDRSFRKSSDSSVMSGILTETDCWEGEAEYDDNDTAKASNAGGSPYIQFRKTTVGIMVLLIFMLMAFSAFFFSVWYNQSGNKSSTFLFPDKFMSEEDVQDLRQENKKLMAKVDNYTTLSEEWNATVVDLEGQLNTCASNYNEAKTDIARLEAGAAQMLNQRKEMEQKNSELLGDVDSLQGEKLILESLKDSLDNSIDRLEEQTKDLSEQNDALNATVKEFEIHVGDLENNNNKYKGLNDQFNESISNLSDENSRLENQVIIYANLNKELNATSYKLGSEVKKLQGEVGELDKLNDRLEVSVNKLEEETENLQELNEELNYNAGELSSQIKQLSGENDQLKDSNNELEIIAGFLDETSQNLDKTYDEITAFLAEQISLNQLLLVEKIQNTYNQRVTSWDCNFADTFRLENFSSDRDLVIPRLESNKVMEYIDDRVLSHLCLSPTDFAQYVEARYGYSYSKSEGNITTNQLVTAVQRYTWAALDYYFPNNDDVDTGLSIKDWAQAGYNCEQFPKTKHFIKFPSPQR